MGEDEQSDAPVSIMTTKKSEVLVTLGNSHEDLPLSVADSNQTVIQKLMRKQQMKLSEQQTFRPKDLNKSH